MTRTRKKGKLYYGWRNSINHWVRSSPILHDKDNRWIARGGGEMVNFPKCYSPFAGERWHQKRFMPQERGFFYSTSLWWSNKPRVDYGTSGLQWTSSNAIFIEGWNIYNNYNHRGLEHRICSCIMTLEEALKIIGSKPDEVDEIQQRMAIIRVQEFLNTLGIFYED